MGYDMTTVTKDPGEDEIVQGIRVRMHAAYDEGRRADGEKLYEELCAAKHSYFRLNIWGMGTARKLMHRAGMLDLDRPAETVDFPGPDTFGVTSEMWDSWTGEPDENAPEPMRAYHAAVEAVVAFQREKPTGIPVHKLGSNDSWLVTPAEIKAALERYVTGGGAIKGAPDWWPQWIAWLRYAKDHGGFRVD